MGSPICIGHRGAKGHRPENTGPSFEYAIELGCDWVELDVYLAGSELIVIHDKKVDRTTNGTGEVAHLSFEQLRSLDAGNGAQIPTLNEIIDLVDHRCGINIELKGENTAEATSELLRNYCTRGWTPGDFLISSFDHAELSLADPTFLRGALFGKLLPDQWQRAANLEAWSVNFDLKDVTQGLVDEAHKKGYHLLVYTVNKPADIEKLMAWGVDGLFSDYPDRVLAARSD